MLHLGSTLVLLLILVGLWFRGQDRRVHMALMVSAFATDLFLVLYIEITRHAVEKVVSHVRPVIWFHAGVSLGVLACYVVMIILGRPMLAGRYDTRALHRTVGMTFLVLRGLNYVTSYMLV
jgi:uncharacterized membrane protein YozB (DUF420 family)